MKKILLIILLFCCNKFILVAQQLTSNLTLVTTDIMHSEVRNQFSWSNVQYSLLRFYQPPVKAIEIMVDPGDGVGNGGNNGTGVTNYCIDRGGSTGIKEEFYDRGVFYNCYKCIEGGHDCVGSVTVQPTGGSTGNTEPFNWGSWGTLGWGNIGSYFATGFLNPPANGLIGGSFIGGVTSGGSSGIATSPIVPPPTNPVTPTGSTTPPLEKDTIFIKEVPCTDTISKKLGDSVTSLMTKYVDTTAMMKRLRDSCLNNTKEEGFTLNMYYDLVTFTTLDSVRTKNYTIATGNQSVALNLTSSCVLQLHLHTAKNIYGNKIAETPSAGDFTNLLASVTELSTNGKPYAKRFLGDIIVNAGGNQEQYAIIPTSLKDALAYDSLLGHNFYNMFDTAQKIITYNDNTNTYDTTHNAWYANWLGDINDKNTNRGIYANAFNKFKVLGYPSDKLDLLAHLVTLQEANIPIKIYIRRNNTFKEIKIESDTITGFYKAIICN